MAEYIPVSANTGPIPFETPVIRVELSVSAVKLRDTDVMSKSDPLCVLSVREKGQTAYIEYGRTECIKDTVNPQWVKKFEVDYRFEERQFLKFQVFDWDTSSTNTSQQDALGEMECSLGEIMSCQGSQFKKNLSSGSGTLIVSGEEIKGSNEIASFNLSGKDLDKKDFFGKSDPFLVIYRCQPDNSFVPVYKSEVIENNLNPVWKTIVIPIRRLCGGDETRNIKIECYDSDSDGSHDLIGGCETNVKTLREGSGSKNTYTLINPKKQKKKGSSYKGSGKLILHNFSSYTEYTFLDYIRGGLQLHFTVAVDFTASNGNPLNPKSLHYRQAGVDNQYSLAIKAVGEIIQDYDTDKMFPALGFGAQIPPDGQVSFEFFLNGRSDTPYCQGVHGILEAYYHSLQTVRLYGPTNFSPVIQHVSQFARNHQDGSSYFVLLIITDGIITDLNETKLALIQASALPMSVIIVAVGDEDFSAMELLDGDSRALSHNGRYAARDIVQFVELRRHLAAGPLSKALLAKDVLAEVPTQVLSWMKGKKIPPKTPAPPQPPPPQS